MSTAGSSSGGSAARMLSGRDRRKVALQVDHDLGLAVGIERLHAPRGSGRSRRGDRHGSSPPRRRAAITAAAISAVSVATATRPIRPPRPAAARARSSAGRRYRASGLPGRRVAAMRAGISTRMRGSVIRNEVSLAMRKQAGNNVGIGGKSGRLYGLPEPGQTDISTLLRVRRRKSLIPDAHPGGRPAGLSVDLLRPGA